MIGRTFAGEQPGAPRGSDGTSHFQTDEAVIVGAISEQQRTIARGLNLHFRHHVLRIGAGILRASRERSDSGIAGRGALSFCGESAVWRTGSNNNPMGDIAVLGRYLEQAAKGCARLQLDHVAAMSIS